MRLRLIGATKWLCPDHCLIAYFWLTLLYTNQKTMRGLVERAAYPSPQASRGRGYVQNEHGEGRGFIQKK